MSINGLHPTALRAMDAPRVKPIVGWTESHEWTEWACLDRRRGPCRAIGPAAGRGEGSGGQQSLRVPGVKCGRRGSG
jgi:hypothetical protein